jgi:hypothetical protein
LTLLKTAVPEKPPKEVTADGTVEQERPKPSGQRVGKESSHRY